MPSTIPPALMTIQDFSAWARIGRTRIYEEIGHGRLPVLKIGRRTYIRTVDAETWLDRFVQSSGLTAGASQ